MHTWGQTRPELARELFSTAQKLQAEGSYLAAIETYEKVIQLDSKDSIQLAFSYENIADCKYENKESAAAYTPYYEKTLGIRQAIYQNPPIHEQLSKSHNDLAFCWAELEDSDRMAYHVLAGAYIDSVLYEEDSSLERASNLAESYSNLGYYWGIRGDWDRQLAYYQKGLVYKRKSGIADSLSVFYNNVATGFWYRNENQLAKAYIDHAITIVCNKQEDSLSIEIIKPLNNLAGIHGQEQNYKEQIRILQRALYFLRRLSSKDSTQAMYIYLNLGYAFLQSQALDSAAYYLDKGLAFAHLLNRPNSKIAGYANMGGLAFMQKNYLQAESWFGKSIRLLRMQFGSHHPELAKNLISLGKCKELQGKYDEAMHLYEQAIQANQNLLLAQGVVDKNPNYQVFSPYQLFSAWSRMGETYFAQYQQTGELAYLEKSMGMYGELNTYNLAIRGTYSHPHDRNKLQGILRQTYGRGIQTAWELYRHSEAPGLLEAIFTFMQTQKALSLFEHLQSSRAWKFSALPDSVRTQEFELQRDLLYYKKQLALTSWNGKSNAGNEWNEKLLTLQEQYQSWITNLEQQFPRYYDLKYKNPVLTIKEARGLFKDQEEGLLEYTMGDSLGFVIAILPDTVRFRSFDPVGIYEDLAEMKKAMQSSSGASPYAELAFDLYQRLLAPEFQQTSINQWTIIPDAYLHYLPFEALVTNLSEVNRFNELPYVLQKSTISYASSCVVLLDENEHTIDSGSQGMMAMAPVFDEEMMERYKKMKVAGKQLDATYLELLPLGDSKNLILKILRFITGKSYLREKAQESTFKEKAGEHQLIHLSTHAIVNDSLPMHSYFVLAKPLESTAQEQEDGYVYTYEIFNMGLTADLAVLTACKTGLGKLQPGEGVMSLARAFQYAGCPSIMMSMWEIDQYASNEVLESFYLELKNGASKREALRKAKLEFLERYADDPEKSSPGFWAGMVVLGNYAPMNLAPPATGVQWYIWTGVLAICMGIAGWFGYRNFLQNGKRA